jgi:hypothetical protein
MCILVRICEYLFDNFPTKSDPKQEGVASSPLPYNFALEYSITKVQENQD